MLDDIRFNEYYAKAFRDNIHTLTEVQLALYQTAFKFLAVSGLVASAFAAEYAIDPAHSEIIFKVRHLGISTVTGRFDGFSGSFNLDTKNIGATKGSATIKVKTVNTNDAKRDEHLRSDDFFNAEKFPQIKFVSKAVKNVNNADTTSELVGDLTIRDITKEVTLKVKGTGLLANDGWGNERAAFKATGSINRFEYNLKWTKLLESGGLVAADKVDLELSFEGVHPLAPPAAAEKKVEKKAKK